jgi:hypothetical protein
MEGGIALLIAGIISIVAGFLILFVLNLLDDYGAPGFKLGIIISLIGILLLFASLFTARDALCGV